MPYVQRDGNGNVNGVARWFTEGVAEEWLYDDNAEVIAYLNPHPGPYSIPKMMLWTRLSDAEAEQVAFAMKSQPARMQGIWEPASEVVSDSEYFGTLQRIPNRCSWRPACRGGYLPRKPDLRSGPRPSISLGSLK